MIYELRFTNYESLNRQMSPFLNRQSYVVLRPVAVQAWHAEVLA
jgi:hypothetical protein